MLQPYCSVSNDHPCLLLPLLVMGQNVHTCMCVCVAGRGTWDKESTSWELVQQVLCVTSLQAGCVSVLVARQDRCIVPSEHFRAMGFPVHGTGSSHSLRDLAGLPQHAKGGFADSSDDFAGLWAEGYGQSVCVWVNVQVHALDFRLMVP